MITELKIGIVREKQYPTERRAPITPDVATHLLKAHKGLSIIVQPSAQRVFDDTSYIKAGCQVTDDLSACDVILGIREIEAEELIPGKKYLFFSHVAKRQPRNKKLLKGAHDNHVTILDYEFLKGTNNKRLVGFGYWAGLVGAYNVIRAYGLKTGQFSILSTSFLIDKDQLFEEVKKVTNCKGRILVTGQGKVTNGVVEVLEAIGAKEVNRQQFLGEPKAALVFYLASPHDYMRHNELAHFSKDYLRSHPQEFESNISDYIKKADIYIAGHYWDSRFPVFLTQEEAMYEDIGIKVFGDVSCDLPGPLPFSKQLSTLEEPFYDVKRSDLSIQPAFSRDDNVTVMTIDNLPSALAVEASVDFANQIEHLVLPYFWDGDYNKVLKRATVLRNGNLNEPFKYLSDYLE